MPPIGKPEATAGSRRSLYAGLSRMSRILFPLLLLASPAWSDPGHCGALGHLHAWDWLQFLAAIAILASSALAVRKAEGVSPHPIWQVWCIGGMATATMVTLLIVAAEELRLA